MTHAATRAVERYGQEFNLAKICRIVRSGRAKFVVSGKDGCAFYDVPYQERISGPGIVVRVLMNADKTFVITVVPPKTTGEIARALIKQRRDGQADQRRKFFRGFEDDEEDCVTV